MRFYGTYYCVIGGKTELEGAATLVPRLVHQAVTQLGPAAYYLLTEFMDWDEPVPISRITGWFTECNWYVPFRLPSALNELGLLHKVTRGSYTLGWRIPREIRNLVSKELQDIAAPPLPSRDKTPDVRLGETPSIPDKKKHAFAKNALSEIATRLGKRAVKEYSIGDFTVDTVWFDENGEITHAFEVQYRGNVEQALARLVTCCANPRTKPFIVVFSQKDETRTLRLVHGAQAPFKELRGKLTILDIGEVKLLSQFLRVYDDKVTAIFKKLQLERPDIAD